MTAGDLKYRRRLAESSLEDLNEANRAYLDYKAKKQAVFESCKKENGAILANAVQINFVKFANDRSFQKAFDYSRCRLDSKETIEKIKTAGHQIEHKQYF